jgi:hypothetical protein
MFDSFTDAAWLQAMIERMKKDGLVMSDHIHVRLPHS